MIRDWNDSGKVLASKNFGFETVLGEGKERSLPSSDSSHVNPSLGRSCWGSWRSDMEVYRLFLHYCIIAWYALMLVSVVQESRDDW